MSRYLTIVWDLGVTDGSTLVSSPNKYPLFLRVYLCVWPMVATVVTLVTAQPQLPGRSQYGVNISSGNLTPETWGIISSESILIMSVRSILIKV